MSHSYFRICTSLLFNGLLFYMGKLPGSIFTNLYYTAVMDAISYIACYFLVPKMTRRSFIFSTFSLAAVSCYSGSFISTFPNYQYLIRWFALVSKLGACGLYTGNIWFCLVLPTIYFSCISGGGRVVSNARSINSKCAWNGILYDWWVSRTVGH